MRRRIVGLVATAAISVSMLGIQPASATHNCTEADCNPVTVAILEGIGYVCNAANINAEVKTHLTANGIAPGTACSYHTDALYNGTTSGLPQGLTWPGRGAPAHGPFSFKAGPGATPPTSLCVSTISGSGCTFNSGGKLTEGVPSGLGAYCGSSKGTGYSLFTATGLKTGATFGWQQSAATILPVQGTVDLSQPPGGVGATVVGFTSSRGLANGGNCMITTITTAFNVEGMIVTF
jgi:hypothetical protein